MIPASPWLDHTPPIEPNVITESIGDSLLIKWSHENKADVFQTIVYFHYQDYWDYQIYNQTENDCTIPKIFEYQDRKKNIIQLQLKEIAVSAVDRLGNESKTRKITIQK